MNLSEKDYIRQKNKHLPKIAEWVKENSAGDPIIPLSICFEERLTHLGDDAAVEEECKKLGTKSALPKVVTTMRQALQLGSFFTTGADEVRQWTIRKGTKAPQAAGVIHTGKLRSVLDLDYLGIQRGRTANKIDRRFRKDLHPSHSVQLRDSQGAWRRSGGQIERQDNDEREGLRG